MGSCEAVETVLNHHKRSEFDRKCLIGYSRTKSGYVFFETSTLPIAVLGKYHSHRRVRGGSETNSMQIWAIGCVRNEADLIRANVLHHLTQGVDKFLILDNGSTDGTDAILKELSSRCPVIRRRQSGPFRQGDLLTQLAREAFIDGAEWILPIDADEFWYAPNRTIRDVLERTSAGALRVQIVNFIQRREQAVTTADALLHMTRRVPSPVGTVERNAELVESEEIAFVEMSYNPKWISRACGTLEIGWGNHYVRGAGTTEETDQIVCLHAPLRSRAVLEAKADLARRAADIKEYLAVAWHLRRWRRIASEARLDAEWQANSYEDECLDLNGQRRPLVADARLRDLVSPWIDATHELSLNERGNNGGSHSTALIDTIDRPRVNAAGQTIPEVPTRRWRGKRSVICGVAIVRNEVDIIATNVLYHLALGLDRFIIADNGSTDGTDRVLERLAARDPRVQWLPAHGPFIQAEIVNRLARAAFAEGATWIVPIDADEFWYLTGAENLHDILDSTPARALRCRVLNFVQRREQNLPSAEGLAHLIMRPRRHIGPAERSRELVESRRFAFVEMIYPPKWITRPSPVLSIAQGNHEVSGVEPRVRTDDIVCFHAPLRARSILMAQVEHGRRLDALGLAPDLGWHVRRWRRIGEAGQLDLEWLANSHANGVLDVYGEPHDLVEDTRLRQAVLPWLDAAGFAASTRTVVADPADGSVPCCPRRTANDFSAVNTVRPVAAGCSATLTPVLCEKILAQMRDIEGWLFEAEAELLAKYAACAIERAAHARIVEIGSYCGRSTIVLAGTVHVLGSQARVCAIDPHDGHVGATDSPIGHETKPPTLERFLQNLSSAGLRDHVDIIVSRSYDVAWSSPIGLLFVDGLHDFVSVSTDVRHFAEWIVPGGFIAFHDYSEIFPGVKACVEKLIEAGHFRIIEQMDALVVLQKSMPNGGVG